MPWTREKNILRHYLFGDKMITYLETKSFKTVSKWMQLINMITIYYWDKNLKKLHVLEADIITIKKKWFDVSSSKDAFLLDEFQMTAIALVTVINHYHINELHVFWGTLYKQWIYGNWEKGIPSSSGDIWKTISEWRNWKLRHWSHWSRIIVHTNQTRANCLGVTSC